jgi:Zn-dependent metalloprotease
VTGRALLAAALLVALLFADGTQTASSADQSPEAIARAYLAQKTPAAATAGLQQAQRRSAAAAPLTTNRGLEHVVTQESPGAYHVRFQETESGVPVFGGSVVVNLDKATDDVGLVTDHRSSAAVASAALSVGASEATDIASQAVGIAELREDASQTLVYYPIEKQLFLAWQIVLPAEDPLGDWLVVVRADNGDVVLQTNLTPKDSGQVFDPNPVVTGGPQSVSNCDTAGNESVVDNQYITRTLLGINSGQNKLKGQYVDLTAPGIVGGYKSAGQASSASHTFTYDCNDDRFEEVMVYYHIDTTQRKLQALGFTGTSAILDEPIPAHAHYYADCNAFYSTVDTGLHYGDCATGGSFVTDTAEDADVIIHEYGHAIQDDQVPGWAFGAPTTVQQARGMGEGFGDFLAASMTGSPCIGDWVNFGLNSCAGSPGLRYLQNTKTYPADFNACPNNPDGSKEEHCTGEIWGGALWDFVEALGGDQDAIDLALRIVIDSQFYLDPQATFDDGVCAIFAADNDLYGGTHGTTIANVFSNRGINCSSVPPPDFPYAFIRIRHTYVGDLEIRIKAGANPASPVCNGLLHAANPSDASVDYVVFLDLTSFCNSHLPPSTSVPWWMEVQDQAPNDTGTIEDFEVVLSGTDRCIASDVPIDIPDGAPGAVVRSKVDCSDISEPLPEQTPDPGEVWYFAEGFTGDGYLTFISLMNPGDTDANVIATFNLDGASPHIEHLVVPANSRRTIPAHDPTAGPGVNWAFGVKLRADQPIVAQEVLVKPSESLAHATIGSKSLSTTWYFAEGFTGDDYLTFISLMNPGDVDATVAVTFNLDGAAPVTKNVIVPANSRRTVPAHDPASGPGPGWAFGVELEADQPIMAQEVLVQPTGHIANDTIGSQSLSTLWYFAEGFTGDGYLTFISLMNPGDTDANVTATFNLDGGSPLSMDVLVPAHSRRTIPAHDPDQGPGPNWAFGTKLVSDQLIVAQEVLVKPSESLAHATIGAQHLAVSWYFAEGFTGDGYLTFISLMNPGNTAAQVTVTFNLDGASPVVENLTLPANSRHTIPAHDPTQGPGLDRAFGVVVTSDQPIVSQEVLVKPSESLAHGTIGTQLSAP